MVTSIISDGRSYPGVTEAAISGAIDRICKEDNNKVNILLSSRMAAPSDGSSQIILTQQVTNNPDKALITGHYCCLSH